MSVSCGIVGLPNVGKSTVFGALTAAQAEIGNYPSSAIGANVAVVEVPDARLELIRGFIPTQKVVPAVVKVVDIAGLAQGAAGGAGIGNKFLGNLKECDALMQVVRCFGGEQVVREDPVDPTGDMEVIDTELALADLETVQRNVTRVAKKARTGDKETREQLAVFERAASLLEQGKPLRHEPWKDIEERTLRPLFLLTMKPVLLVANVADDDLDGSSDYAQEVARFAVAHNCQWLPICGDLENELRRLDGDEQELFMSELGVVELGLDRLIHATYELLGLQTFFTAGEKEVRAWTIHRGDTAPVAAGVIHSDFQKAFIRVEAYSVDDLAELHSEAALKAAGRMRTEGKTYTMQEGDVCHFLVGK